MAGRLRCAVSRPLETRYGRAYLSIRLELTPPHPFNQVHCCWPTWTYNIGLASDNSNCNGSRKLKQTLCHSCRTLWPVWPTHCFICRFQSVSKCQDSLFYSILISFTTRCSKEEGLNPARITPFDCCSLSFQPFSHPVCARNSDGRGNVFDLTNIIPWLKCV